MPRVSVIVPSYNHERFVGAAIDSALAQTFQDFEIVVTDDGSSDGTFEILRGYRDPRIRLRRFERNRQVSSRNEALSRARGELIAVLMSDDVWEPYKLERQVAFLDAHPEVGAVFSRAAIIGEDGRPFPDAGHFYISIFEQENRSRHEWLRRFFLDGNCLCHPSAVMRRAVIEEVGPYDPLLAQLSDLDLWVRICLRYEIWVLEESLVRMRLLEHEANASGDRPDTARRCAWEMVKVLRHYRSQEAVAQLESIFPELEGIPSGAADSAKLFALARLALERESEAVLIFGLELAYELLSDDARRGALEEVFGGPLIAEFIRQSGRSPLGSVCHARAELFWPEKGEYRPEFTYSSFVRLDELDTVRLRCPGARRGERLRVDPSDQPSLLEIASLRVVEEGSGRTALEIPGGAGFDAVEVDGTARRLPSPTGAEGLRLLSYGDDPRLILPPLELDVTGPASVTVRMRVGRDLSELASLLPTPELPK